MRASSSLSLAQREQALALFEADWGASSVATRLGVSQWAVKAIYDRWRVRGGAALVTKPTKRSFSFEFKRDVVGRFLAGETKMDLAQEFDLSSPKLIDTWARKYRNEGEDGLRPKLRGRPRGSAVMPGEIGELEQWRRENEPLRAEVAYLEKLRALRAQERR